MASARPTVMVGLLAAATLMAGCRAVAPSGADSYRSAPTYVTGAGEALRGQGRRLQQALCARPARRSAVGDRRRATIAS